MKRLQHIRPWMLALTGAAALALTPTSPAEDKIIIEKAPTETRSYRYVYYPEQEIYLVPETHRYVIREGGTFHEVKELPAGVSLGSSVNLVVDKPDPWTKHEVIVKKYGHGKSKTKETYTDENGNEKTRETIRQKDGDVIIKEKTKDND